MSGPDRDHDSGADELARTATPFEQDLAALEPAAPSGGLRERIAAELAAAPATPTRRARGADLKPTRGQAISSVIERLAWAVGGALAATVVLGLTAGDAPRRDGSERIVVAGPEVPETRPLSEQTGRWADEGVTFLDDTTPARILRRMVVERHRAPDGLAEVRVPRADVSLLPVAGQ